jgi:cholesterol oxidase
MSGAFDYDVIVVGTGMGGASAAESLARAGLKVCMLERGTWWGAFGGHHPLPENLLQLTAALTRVNFSGFGLSLSIPLSRRGVLEASVHSGTIVVNASAVGGNSVVSGGLFQRPAAQFFDGMPAEITASELEPHYQRIERALNVSQGPQNQCKLAELNAVANQHQWTLCSAPQAIRWDTDDQKNKPACTNCNLCGFACNVGAKQGMDKNLIPSAIKAGAVLHDLCVVQTVTRVAGGYEVLVNDARNGRGRVLRATRVVMAAGVLNTVKILLRSVRDGELSPMTMLGRHFSMGGDTCEFYRVPQEVRPSEGGHFLEATTRVPHPANGLEFDHQILNLTPPFLQGSWLLRTLQGKHTLPLFGFGPDAMDGNMSLQGESLRVSAKPQAVVGRIQATMDRIAQAYGWQKPVRPLNVERCVRPWLSCHPVGGSRMASDASRGVVDFKGEVFGHPGLYITDASIFPSMTIGGPQLTVSALASWVAERIVQDAG